MYDYHTHSTFSGDAVSGMEEIIEAAIASGLDEIAITDHFDPEYPDTDYDMELEPEPYEAALDEAAEKYAGRITVVKGIEYGMQLGEPLERGKEVISSYDFDFVIGSVHSAFGGAVDTPMYLDYRDDTKSVIDYYAYLIDCMKEFNDYDVLGHLNVMDRYVSEIPKEEIYWDLADEAMKLAVAEGKGLEINAKCFRIWHGAHTTPTLKMLKRFRELGGEIITTGSDAHSAAQIGSGLKDAEELARAAGFNYIATFRSRKPNFVKL
jgi:histidinol-phosphatase (PHP family)